VLFWRAALGCYAAAVLLAGLALVRPWSVYLTAGVGLAGVWCQRAAVFVRRLEDATREEADVPGD
jgi:uncharacterized membrane protein YhaH (DUF805 family)